MHNVDSPSNSPAEDAPPPRPPRRRPILVWVISLYSVIWAVLQYVGSRSFIGMRRTGSGKKKSSGNATWMMTMKRRKPARHFAVCINNRGYPASLELHKIYRVLPDEGAAEDGDIRVIDESGEDYLYPADRFVEVELPQTVRRSLLHAA